ncbi:MAG: GntR family transcriptional regulator [Eubacteriales bacterium]|nr:GntR family transcriptional regulator [Christensenellaceae bacterium]MEA5065599.1 GntR family transcriptional regulator [Eubacteriales bacterium]
MSEKMSLISESYTTLYEQMMQHLRVAIRTGQYAPGQRLPSEAEMCRQFGVSRITARRAVQELVSEGLLERKQGKGTFVGQPKIAIKVMAMDGFQGFSSMREGDSYVRVLRKERRGATGKEAGMLGIPPGAPVCELVRVLEVENSRISLDRSVFTEGRLPGLMDLVQDNTSTYELMEKKYGLQNVRVVKEITATLARPDEARDLKCNTGDSLFLVEKTTYGADGLANHCSFNLMCADRVKMTITYERSI